MSTILKALKKLEQDKAALQTGGLPSGYMGPGSPQLRAHRGIGRLFSPTLLRGLILLVIVSLGITTFYFYRQSRTAPPTATLPKAAENRPPGKPASPARTKPAMPDQAKVERPSRETKIPAPTAKRRPKPDKLPAGPKQTNASGTRPGTADWKPLNTLTQTGNADAEPARSTAPEPAPPAARTIKAVAPQDRPPKAAPVPAPSKIPAAVPAPAPEDPYKDIAPLTDGRLKVQAIAWSPDVEDRMAVINTRIVHEGDKVDGFVVSAIRKDDVVVGSEGSYYRVIFGRP